MPRAENRSQLTVKKSQMYVMTPRDIDKAKRAHFAYGKFMIPSPRDLRNQKWRRRNERRVGR